MREKIIPEEPHTDLFGNLRWLQTVKRPIVGPDGKAHQILGVATDITARKLAEEELRRYQERLEEEVEERTAELKESNEQLRKEVAERKQAEAALRESEERFRALYEDTPSMYFTVDRTGTVLSVNQFGAAQLGCAAEDLVGQSVLRVFSDPDKPAAFRHLMECVDDPGRVFHWELRKIRRDGSCFWVKETARAVRNRGGELVVLIVCEDITERKNAEEALHRSEEQLRQAQKMQAVGRLAGGIAHDFNNLLNVIAGYTELMLYELAGDAPLRTHAENIRNASDKAAGLVRQLLAFSRQQVATPKVLDLNTVLLETGELLPRLIGENIELTIDPSKQPALVRADPIQMQQILINLAVNARDAMPNGGKLMMTTACVELNDETAAQQLGCAAGAYALLSVRDTGAGISREIQPHIFEPFFTTKEQGKGTGLGLFTVYGIVQQAGGAISIDSESGVGTTFKIYLPRVVESVEAKPLSAIAPELLRGTETILLVEDQENLRGVLRVFLQKQGYTVLEAGRPSEALQVAAQCGQKINLLITDVVMPGMQGPDLARHIRERYPDVKTLLLSGYAPNRVVFESANDKKVSFLEKPVSMQVLAQRIREILTPASGTVSVPASAPHPPS